MRRNDGIRQSDWDVLEEWIKGLKPDQLKRLTQKTKKLTLTAQIKLLRQAAERVRGGGQETDTQREERLERKRKRVLDACPKDQKFAKRQGEEKMEGNEL